MHIKPFTSVFSFLLVVSLVFVGVISTPYSVYGETSPEVTLEQAYEEAINLKKLGLLEGTGNGFALEEIPTRLQGIIMLIRMMGEEDDAKNCTYTHPFKDVPAWGDRYVAWAYQKKYTAGTSATTFSSTEPMTVQQYLAFTLRAMGYGNDTVYANTIDDARRFGIIPNNAYGDTSAPFLRADMIHITYLALQANEKTTGNPFYIYLIDKGTLDPDTANHIFNPESADEKEDKNNEDISGTNNNNNNNINNLEDLLSFLGYGISSLRTRDSGIIISLPSSEGQPNTSLIIYSYTNTNNNKSSYTLSIRGNKLIIDGYETANLDYIALYLIEENPRATGSHHSYRASKYISHPGIVIHDSLDIPDLNEADYYRVEITAKHGNKSSYVMNDMMIKGSRDAWHFVGPMYLESNNSMAQRADDVKLTSWLEREWLTDEFKQEVISLMGKARSSTYETAYNVYLWITENIEYDLSCRDNSIDTMWILKNRKAVCSGYSNLMADALSVYGIPARVASGDVWDTTEGHAWVEFYDEISQRWVVCDPTWGTGVPKSWFDLDRTYIASSRKIVTYNQ